MSEKEQGRTRVAQATIWRDRVLRWRDLQREDLRADAVPAPGAPGQYWLLYRHKKELTMTESEIVCPLCKKCATSLSKRRARGGFAVQTPHMARAKGLWQGPEPEAIRVLTNTGRRILRLARVHACVKRVSPHLTPWATANERARPQYSTRNAVAFAQDPDAVVQVLRGARRPQQRPVCAVRWR